MSYSFLRESKLYLEYSGTKYRIHTTTAISFSQTFAEDLYSVKTLHDQAKMFEGTAITKANPAQFSFTVPLTVEKDESIVMDMLVDLVTSSNAGITEQQLKNFDLFIQTGSSTFKLDDCVITSANLAFNPREQFVMTVEGQGVKLTRVGDENFNLGTIQSESSTRTPLLVYPEVTLDSLNMTSIIGLTVQIQNDIQWTPYENLHSSLGVTDSSNAMFPSTYTVVKRIVSGAITQYQTDNNNTQFDDFNGNCNINIHAKKVSDGSTFWHMQINPAMYTARLQTGEVYSQSYDFRSTDNTATLAQRITTYS